jgi:16S rRNA (cytidine1402-2'-O)-methyltransferase
MVAYHEHNEARTLPRILGRLSGGDDLSLVSDAGTPLISDPGARLVSAAIEAGHQVVPVPGASALLAALAASGLATEPFTFFGFLPRQGGARRASLAAALETPHTVVLYEAPQRVAATLDELTAGGAGERPAVVARELTKRFEEFRRGTVTELAAYYRHEAPRGEVVIVLGPAQEKDIDEAQLADSARRLRVEGLSVRDTARRLVEEFGAPRNLAYRLARDAEA